MNGILSKKMVEKCGKMWKNMSEKIGSTIIINIAIVLKIFQIYKYRYNFENNFENFI